MNIDWELLAAPCAGLALGFFFFGGLWWTLRRALLAAHPALLLFASLLLRMGIILAGFYFVGAGSPLRMMLCLLGFVIARFLVVRLTREPEKSGDLPRQDAAEAAGTRIGHAP